MLITKAVLRNFGPYYGEQHIELGPGERPLTLVHGENMRGKTSLLNAIRWALYGQVRTRTGTVMPASKLLNMDALEAGAFIYSVELEVSDGYDKYVLTRQALAHERPTRDTDFEFDLHVRKNDNFLSADAGEVEIARLLPRDVSQFFLFDGEMLNDFEELLADPTQQSQAIKRSVEQILGVPAVENTITDLATLHRDAERRQTQAAKTVKAAEKDAERAEQLAAEIAAAERDVRAISDDMEATQTELANVDDELRRFELVRSEADALDRTRADLRTIGVELTQHEDARRSLLADAWLDVLSLAVAPRVESLERERDELIALERRATQSRSRRAMLETMTVGSSCPLCGSMLTEEHGSRVREELAALPVAEPPNVDRLEAVVGSISRLRTVRAAGVGPRVEGVEREIRRATVRRTELRNRVTELETTLRDHPLDKIGHLQRHRDRLLKTQGGYEDAHMAATDHLEVLKAQAASVRLRIAQVSDPQLDRLNREVELYESLLRAFQNALDDLVEELKSVIEKDASEVFLQLTTDKTYRGLRINDYYGLYIVGGSGDDVPVRSAGAEQIVALSLIAALNRNAVKKGPVIMDTPFGRLDVKHRANILSFLSTMADQVVLLVHSGEVDRERDLAVVAPHVQREYELRFVSSTNTVITPLVGTGAESA